MATSLLSFRVNAKASTSVPPIRDAAALTQVGTAARCDVWSVLSPTVEIGDVTSQAAAPSDGEATISGTVKMPYKDSENVRQRVADYLSSEHALRAALGALDTSSNVRAGTWSTVANSVVVSVENGQPARSVDHPPAEARLFAPMRNEMVSHGWDTRYKYADWYNDQFYKTSRPGGFTVDDLILGKLHHLHRSEGDEGGLRERYGEYFDILERAALNSYPEDDPRRRARGDRAYVSEVSRRTNYSPVASKRRYDNDGNGERFAERDVERRRSPARPHRPIDTIDPRTREFEYGHYRRRVAPVDDRASDSDDPESFRRNTASRVESRRLTDYYTGRDRASPNRVVTRRVDRHVSYSDVPDVWEYTITGHTSPRGVRAPPPVDEVEPRPRRESPRQSPTRRVEVW